MNTETTIIATRSKRLAESLARAIAAVSHRAIEINQNERRNWFELEMTSKNPLPGEIKVLRGIAKNLVMLVRLRRKHRQHEDGLLESAQYVLQEYFNNEWGNVDGPTPDLQQLLDVRPSRRTSSQILQLLKDGRSRPLYRSKENGWELFYPEKPFARDGWQADMQDVQEGIENRNEKHARAVAGTRAGLRNAVQSMVRRSADDKNNHGRA